MYAQTLHQSDHPSNSSSQATETNTVLLIIWPRRLYSSFLCMSQIVVSTQRGSVSNHGDVQELSTTQEEADTILILHALHTALSGADVHIMSPDTDVFVLAI